MFLMLKDLPILQMNPDEFEFTVYREELLPYDLKNRFVPVPPDTISTYKAHIRAVERNIRYVQDFLMQRVLPLSRANAKKIYNLYGDNQENKLRISLMCRAVSLLDNYWVKLCGDTITWRDVSIRDNHLNEVFTQVALRGSSLSLTGSLTSPETTTNGTYTKGWKREDGDLFLYKKGPESRIEVMVSKLLDKLNIPHLAYTDAVDDGVYCCKCKCMSSENLSIVDALTAESWFNRKGESFIPYIKKHFADDLYRMWITDYLTANPDRHGQNWGFFFDANTTEILGLHFLFDHNNAFDTAYMKDPDASYIAMSDMTMRQAAMYAAKRVKVEYTIPFQPSDFITERQYQCFTSRLKDLGIRRKQEP
ncbi:MAG: hypothetical protein K2N87_11475 [Eubacterium sp.]|nr:hypothetical protein [Eubacterium sp.]